MPARATAPAAASTPPTPWPASPRRSASRCRSRPRCRPSTRTATSTPTPSGEAVMSLIEKNIRPRDICTREAFENAAIVVAATGGSTNGGLHLPAMAHECGISFTMDDCVNIMRKTPYLADLRPGGRYRRQGDGRGGRRADAADDAARRRPHPRRLHDRHRQDDRENLEGRDLAHRPGRHPPRLRIRFSETGGVVGLKGSLAPDGAIVKIAGLKTQAPRPRARVRRRGSLLRRRRAPRLQARAKCSSSATRVRRAAPACAKCSRPPPPSTARAWATRSRWSPTAVSPAPRAASASAMSAPRRRKAARSRW